LTTNRHITNAKLKASFLNWGLNEDQEQVLIKVVQDGVDESLDHYESLFLAL